MYFYEVIRSCDRDNLANEETIRQRVSKWDEENEE
jgi:hypothetical protein